MLNKNFWIGWIKLILVLVIGGLLGFILIDFNRPFSIILFTLLCCIIGLFINNVQNRKRK